VKRVWLFLGGRGHEIGFGQSSPLYPMLESDRVAKRHVLSARGGSDGCCLIVQQRRPMIEKANEICVTL